MTSDAHRRATPDDDWLRSCAAEHAAELAAEVAPGAAVGRVDTPSGAVVAVVADVVVKVHRRHTDPAALAARLAVVSELAASALFVPPLAAGPVVEPATGRLVTVWPRMLVLSPDEDASDGPVPGGTDPDRGVPWADAGALLARLHTAPLPPAASALSAPGGGSRLGRAVGRVDALPTGEAERALLRSLGARLRDEVDHVAREHRHPVTLVHGDWHLGQLARTDRGWRLIDIDDLGVGDPVWDLGRPAGFWAAGLLDDAAWSTFLAAYRGGAGPGVPATGDPWPRLDLAARCAVFVATVRALAVQSAHSENPADSLLSACARM